MHVAPSVSYPVGRSFWHGLFIGAVSLSSCVVWVAWFVQSSVGRVTWISAAAIQLLICAVALRALQRTQRGKLCWTGADWRWPADDAVGGEVEVVVDAQFLLVVRWRSDVGRAWLWLERSQACGRWEDLRRAVYSRARPDALPGT